MCSPGSAQKKILLTLPLRRSALISVVSLTGLMLGQTPTPLVQAQTGWSVRDLHPGEYETSNSNGVSESIQGATAHFLIDLESGPMGPWIEPRAGYWRGTSGTFVEINPPGSLYSSVSAVWGELFVGYFADSHWFAHAGVWTSPTAPAIDLNPAGYNMSKIFATNGRQHAGYAKMFPMESYGEVAMLWTGTSTEAVRLAIPSDAKGACATAMSTNQQGGFVYFSQGEAGDAFRHAFLWNGEGGRVVDLHPIGAFTSEIRAMTDTYQAGTVTLSSAQNTSQETLLSTHAALWFGSPERLSVVGPAGSYIQAASGPFQVGASNGHATLWASSASSAFDLHTLLPSGYHWSAANSIWSDGNRIVIGGCADSHAVLWTYTPPGVAPQR